MEPLGHCTPTGTSGPCWHCVSFVRMVYAGSAARCAIAGGHRVQAQPASGCAFWLREPGADDEVGPPALPDAQAVLKPVEAPAKVAWAP